MWFLYRDIYGVNMDVELLKSAGTAIGIVFFFQAEDGIRDKLVTRVQTCALPISGRGQVEEPPTWPRPAPELEQLELLALDAGRVEASLAQPLDERAIRLGLDDPVELGAISEIGRASCRERVEISVGAGSLKKKVL